MIRWIFWDVGNVLFNDDPQTYHIHRRYHEAAARHHPAYGFDCFLGEREQEVQRGNRWPAQTVLRRYLPPEQLDALYRQITEELRGIYDHVNLLMPGTQDLVRELAGRYRMGVIANQVAECRGSLERRGLLDYFDVVAISEELDLHKPDPRLFQWALDRAGALACEAVMIGDRHDNDIVPADGLGMHTIWVRWGSGRGKGWSPLDPLARSFLGSHARVPFYDRTTDPNIAASATVSELSAIPRALEQLNLMHARQAQR